MNARVLQNYEAFLETIPLRHYREHLMPVKTVEQDLPPALNPLPAIYAAYWQPDKDDCRFPDFEEFFTEWWKSHLEPLDEFIRKYFWGCSLEFVRLGFKARLYRTLISVLTQFHFAYAWKAFCRTDLQASSDLDRQGVDALVSLPNGAQAALQVKKVTYRREARDVGRFAQRRSQAGLVVEIPYTISAPEEWVALATRARARATRDRYQLFAFLASHLQRWLSNGFVIFQPEYPLSVERLIAERMDAQGTIPWDEVLGNLKERRSPLT